MSQSFTVVGGSQVGWVSASWPFAKLSVSKERLVLSTLGTYSFEPQQVAALEPHGVIPIIGRGIRIVHSRTDFPSKIVFWCFGSPDSLITRIKQLGFMPKGTLASVPQNRGIPYRILGIVVVIALWNGLFMLDQADPSKKPGEPGWLSLLAIGLLGAAAWALPYSKHLQSLVLKEGRTVSEIQSFMWLLRIVLSFLFVGFLVVLVTK
jgi:hypothetical protein